MAQRPKKIDPSDDWRIALETSEEEDDHNVTDLIPPQELFDRADGGDVKSQFLVGLRLFDLKRNDRDPDRAVDYLEKAASGGHERAKYTLGVIYLAGNQPWGGPEQNMLEAAELLLSSGRNGFEAASSLLIHIMYYGWAVTKKGGLKKFARLSENELQELENKYKNEVSSKNKLKKGRLQRYYEGLSEERADKPMSLDDWQEIPTARGTPRVRRPKRTKAELDGSDPQAEANKFDVKLGGRVSRELRDRFLACVKADENLTQGAALTEALEAFLAKNER